MSKQWLFAQVLSGQDRRFLPLTAVCFFFVACFCLPKCRWGLWLRLPMCLGPIESVCRNVEASKAFGAVGWQLTMGYPPALHDSYWSFGFDPLICWQSLSTIDYLAIALCHWSSDNHCLLLIIWQCIHAITAWYAFNVNLSYAVDSMVISICCWFFGDWAVLRKLCYIELQIHDFYYACTTSALV